MDTLRVVVKSECVERTSGRRCYPNDVIEVTREEFERLLKAQCVCQPIPEEATVAAPETMKRPRRRAKM